MGRPAPDNGTKKAPPWRGRSKGRKSSEPCLTDLRCSVLRNKAISWPARQIAINAGEDGSIVVGKILEKDTYAFGYDAQTGEYGNLVSKGIIDPTKVVRTALQDAASIAGLLITTEAMVAELPKKQSAAMPGGPGGGMGGMDF